jgi:hypothetical protein
LSKSTKNVLTKGYSGKFGKDFVLKDYGVFSVLAKKPVFHKPWSEKQKEHRKKFARAARSARALSNNPEIRREYEPYLEPGTNIFNLILKDVYLGKEVRGYLKMLNNKDKPCPE